MYAFVSGNEVTEKMGEEIHSEWLRVVVARRGENIDSLAPRERYPPSFFLSLFLALSFIFPFPPYAFPPHLDRRASHSLIYTVYLNFKMFDMLLCTWEFSDEIFAG